jgi:hypothetical protein
MTGTNCDLFTHKSSRSYLNHLVFPHRISGLTGETHERTKNIEYLGLNSNPECLACRLSQRC